jgi:hypothetical protein
VGPRDGLEDVEKRKFLTIPGLELQPLGRPASTLKSSTKLKLNSTYSTSTGIIINNIIHM